MSCLLTKGPFRLAVRWAGLCALLCATAPLAAQEPTPPLSPKFFKERRQALMKALGKGLVVLRGAPSTQLKAKFYQDHDYYYLTGVMQENTAILLDCDTGKDMLLVEPFSRFTARWDGKKLVPNEATAKRAMFDSIGNVRSLKRILDERLGDEADARPETLWTLFSPQPNRSASNSSASSEASKRRRDPFDGRISREEAFRKKLADMFPEVKIRSVDRAIRGLRGVKQPAEIVRIEAATRIAAAGIAEAMKSTEPGVYEFQVAAAARYVFDRMGAGPDAYAAIVGSGSNGCILHYRDNDKKTISGELIVMDYAPTVQGYASDVTRTFPVNGKFTDEQRKLVQDVYDVQQILIGMIKPGVSLGQLNMVCSRELRKRGYVSRHGPCHHVGLSVHDVGGGRLEPGMLITVEPGAYLDKKGMGCRIEDVILVTEDGHRNLSGHLPAKPEDVEKLMQQKGIQQAKIGLDK